MHCHILATADQRTADLFAFLLILNENKQRMEENMKFFSCSSHSGEKKLLRTNQIKKFLVTLGRQLNALRDLTDTMFHHKISVIVSSCCMRLYALKEALYDEVSEPYRVLQGPNSLPKIPMSIHCFIAIFPIKNI